MIDYQDIASRLLYEVGSGGLVELYLYKFRDPNVDIEDVKEMWYKVEKLGEAAL